MGLREPTGDPKTDKALAALDTLAAMWAMKINLRDAVRKLMAAPDAEDRLVEFVQACWGEGAYAGRTSPRAPAREHTTSKECWCCPVLDFKDPATGAEVWVHRVPQ